jgi:hypothetical protein
MCSCPRVGNTRHWLSTLAVKSPVSRNVANGLLATGIPRPLSSGKVKSGLNVVESVVSITECPEAVDSSYRQSSAAVWPFSLTASQFILKKGGQSCRQPIPGSHWRNPIIINNTRCVVGNIPLHDRIRSTGGKHLCHSCAKLNGNGRWRLFSSSSAESSVPASGGNRH